MKKYYLLSGLLLSFGSYAEIWEKPKYTPDEGHLQEEMERQEEISEKEKKSDQRHQDQTSESNPNFEIIDDEMTEETSN